VEVAAFTRGLIKGDNQTPIHFLFMDDDIDLDSNLFTKLSCMNTLKSDFAVAEGADLLKSIYRRYEHCTLKIPIA